MRYAQWRPEEHPRDEATGRFVRRTSATGSARPMEQSMAGESTGSTGRGRRWEPESHRRDPATGRFVPHQAGAWEQQGTGMQGSEATSMGAGRQLERRREWHAGEHPRDPMTGRFVRGEHSGWQGEAGTSMRPESMQPGAEPSMGMGASQPAARRREWHAEDHPRDPQTGRFVGGWRGWLRRYFG